MPKRKKKTTTKKRKEEFSHEDTPPPAKKVDTIENEASSTSHIEEDNDQVQYFTSISIQNKSDANDLSHYWCNYCSFSTDTRKDLIAHMREHMNKCPFCSFASLSLKEVSKHSKIEHDKDLDAVSQESDSSSSCEMDKDPCSACIFCEFMTYSTEHLERHTVLKHPGLLAKSVAKMITKQSSAQIRRDDALFYLTISSENISEIKKSTTELHPIVIDMKPDIKPESRPTLGDLRANQTTKLLKEKGETCMIPAASTTTSENQNSCAKDEISSSGTVLDRKVKVETMYCLTCPYSNVYIEKLKCHTLAQHPLGAAVCTYNSSSENSTEQDVTFFCIREDCSYNSCDSKAYQKHLMDCCSCRSAMTVLEKERLQASIAYINSFQKKIHKDAERGFSNFVQSFLNYPDSSSTSLFQSNGNINAAGRDPLFINKDTVHKLRPLSEMQHQMESLLDSRHEMTTSVPLMKPVSGFNLILPDSNPRKTPDMYKVGGAEMKTNLVSTPEQFSTDVLAFKLGSDKLHSSVGSSINQQLSSSTSSADSAIRNKQQNMVVDLSNSILMSGDCGSEMSLSQNLQENLKQSADPLLRPLPLEGMNPVSAMPPVYHDSLNNSIPVKPTSTVIDLNDETWQNSQHNSSTFISPQLNNALQNNALHCQSSLNTLHDEMPTTNTSVNQTSVPNFLVTTNSPIPETESNESHIQPTFLTPSKNVTHSFSTPPKNTNNLANAAGSSPLSPSIYLSGQAPRHKRGNWTEADMRPRNIMMPPLANMVPQFPAPPGHVRQQLFTSGNTRGRSGRGRPRMPHNPRHNVEDDDVIVTAVVRNVPATRPPAVRRGGVPIQTGRMVPMPRLPVPPRPNNRGRSLQATPPKQFDISKHFEDLACVVNSTGDENDGNLGDDDIQILGVTPGKDKEKAKHPRAVDASKFSFSCLHCGKDQGSKMQMKQHMKAYHNDSLIGAFTNIETGQLLFFCPQLTCEFMTYEEQRLSEHLYKCYNIDHSKPFDVITAIKNLKSVKIRQLDVKSMGRFQDNSAYLDGQGLKDNFSNSLNDAFDDIVVNASGRHMPKPSPAPRQVPQPLVHPTNLVSPRHPSGLGPPVRHQSGHLPPRQRFYPPQLPYGIRPSNNEIPRLAHNRLPSARLDMRMARGMFPRSRGQLRSPMRPLLTGPRFGGEQEPIVIDDEPPFPVSNLFHSGQNNSSLSLSGTSPSISDHSPATTFDDTRHEDTYSSRQEIVNDSYGRHLPSSITQEISEPHDFHGSVRPVNMSETAHQAYSNPDSSSNTSVLQSESVADKEEPSSVASENTLNAASTMLNNSVLNTPGTNMPTSEVPSLELFSSGAIEDTSFEEEEKNYANMLEKVFAKVPNMPKKLSYRLISKFKQYSKDIGAKITSNVIDEFVSKISYRGSSAIKAAPTSAPSVTEQLETSDTPKEHIVSEGPGDHGAAPPDHCLPDVLTTQVIMAERELKFSGSFANLPLKYNEVTLASSEKSSDSSCQEAPIQERSSSSTENLQSDEPLNKSDRNSSEQLDGSSLKVQHHTQSSTQYDNSLNENPIITQLLKSNITRRHSTEIINAKSDIIEDIRSSSCPVTSTKNSEWRIAKANKFSTSFPPYCRKVKKNISPCVMTVTAEVHVPSIQAVIEDDFLQPAILHKENSLSLISSTSPILITSNVDHLVSGHADLEVDIAGKPENHNLLLVEKLEPPDELDHVSSDSRVRDSSSTLGQPLAEQASPNTQSQESPLLIDTEHKNECALDSVKKTVKNSSKKQKKKHCSLIDSKTGMLIPKVTKRGRPRSKLNEAEKPTGENSPCELIKTNDFVKSKSPCVSDVQADQNESSKDDLEIKGIISDTLDSKAKPLNTNEAEIHESSPGIDIKEKDDDNEKSIEDDDSLNKDPSAGSAEIFVRRSDRKRKCVKSDYRGEEGAELDDLLDDSDEDYTFDDDDSGNDESTWMKQSGLAPIPKKKVKKVKPPPDPTAFNVSTKGKFRCWMCKKVFLKSTCAKAHLLKKHKEGLCSIDLIQSEETNVLHLLLYCVRDCKYATFSLEGYKSHIASCQKPEYTSQDDNYLQSNKTFIDVLYPELLKTDAKDFLQNQSQKVNKSSKAKKSKTSKDKVTVTLDDVSGSEQSSISPPLQGAANETVPQILIQPSSLNPPVTSPPIQNKVFTTPTDQHFSRISIPSVPRSNAGQHNQRIITHHDVPSSDLLPPKLSPQPPRLTAEYSTPKFVVDYRAPRLISDQFAPRLSPLQHASVTFDQTGSRFSEHPAQPVRPPMQSKHNIRYQSPSYIRPASQPIWQQAQKIPGAKYPVDDQHIHQGPRHAYPSQQTVSGQTVNFKVQDISSSSSNWQNRNHSNIGQQDIDNIYVEENGTICLE